jgi:trk system potassium uptake protein TrkH
MNNQPATSAPAFRTSLFFFLLRDKPYTSLTMKKFLSSLNPLQLLIYGYAVILILGFALLRLPFMRTTSISSLDDLFTTTSALSTTGLATVDVSQSYTFWGQLVILILIQIGGLGYMSLGSFFVLIRQRKLSNINSELLKYDFSLPENFSVLHFIRSMVFFTIGIELIGALVLMLIFWQAGETGVVWKGIFHSISAFCTAGFSLFSDSFMGYANNFALNAVIAVLSISGALGFIVFTDLFERASGRKQRITFTSRIIIRFTFLGILAGAVVLFLSDTNIAAMPPEEGLMIALFQSMTAFTTVGFNTYEIGAILPAPMFFVLLLMIVGASPSGTGGGMKSTTFTALYAQLKSTFRGDAKAVYMNRTIPDHKVAMATSNFFFYVLTICIGTYLLLLVQEQPVMDVLFEAISALGTVGISTGITGDLTVLGKLMITMMMFLGRIGPLSFGMVLFHPSQDLAQKGQVEDLAI